MKQESTRRGLSSLVIVILLAAILVALIALIILVVASPQSGPGTKSSSSYHAASESPSSAPVTRREREESGAPPPPPPAPVDTRRLVQTCEPGKKYRSVVRVHVQGKANAKDWGIAGQLNFEYLGEMEFVRDIRSNDGNTIVLNQTVRRARSLAIGTTIESLRLELSGSQQLALETLGHLSSIAVTGAPLPPGWSKVAVGTVNSTIDSPALRDYLSRAEQDQDAKAFKWIDDMEGKTVTITYENGKGVTKIEPVNCALSRDEQDMLMATSVVSDAYLLPNMESKPGDTWHVTGSELGGMIDPSLRSVAAGSVTVRRGPDRGTPDRKIATILVEDGTLDLTDVNEKTKGSARWAPRGSLEFDFSKHIITKGDLKGAFVIEQRSTDHIIFEASWSVSPQYVVEYWCDIVP